MSDRATAGELRSSEAIIYKGATQSDVVQMFRMTPSDVKKKLTGLRPVGFRNGSPIYTHRDIADTLGKPSATVIEEVLRMHPNDLPKMLAKEWWMSQIHMLNYQTKKGDLWQTAAVVALVSQIFKDLRLQLLLLSDTLERSTGLTEQQRTILAREVTSALLGMKEKVEDGLNNRRSGTFGQPGTPEKDDPAEGL